MHKTSATVFRGLNVAVALAAVALCASIASAEQPQVVLNRDGSTISLEAYAPNIIRVTLSLLKEPALAAPGFGFVATASAAGWAQQHSDQADTYRSSRLVVSVAKKIFPPPPCPHSWISPSFSMAPPRPRTSPSAHPKAKSSWT